MDGGNFQVWLDLYAVVERKMHSGSQTQPTSERVLIRSPDHQAIRCAVIVSSLPDPCQLRLRLYKKLAQIEAFSDFQGTAQGRNAVKSCGGASVRCRRVKIVPELGVLKNEIRVPAFGIHPSRVRPQAESIGRTVASIQKIAGSIEVT